MLPRFDEAQAATGIAGNVGRDARTIFANQAARDAAAKRWLESATLETEELRRELPSLTSALQRHADAARGEDAALRAIGIHTVASSETPVNKPSYMRIFDDHTRAKYIDEATLVNKRCGFLFTDPAGDFPECRALVNTLAHALAPAEGVAMSTHVTSTLTELAAIHSEDAGVEAALRSFELVLHELATAFLVAVAEGPADTKIANLRALSRSFADARTAAEDVASAATKLRAMCK